MTERFNLFEGNCLEVMATMAENSIDSIVTDPPYELGFMGKSWDSSGVAFNVEVWQEALRVLKPGGHLLAFSGSRTYHRMAVAIEDAGFEIRDQIMWIYGSGFPKSHNVSKGIDKSDAVEMRRQRDLKFTEWMRSTGITGKQINDLTSSNMGNHYLTDKEQPTVATAEMFDKLRTSLPEVPEWVEQMVRERTIESENFKKREVVGTKLGTKSIDGAGHGIVPGGITESVVLDITAPATPAAKQWDGWGTALKPAHEPIVVARKPVIGTVANNVLTFGTGGLNIDGARVAHLSEADRASATPQGKVTSNKMGGAAPDTENDGRVEVERPDTSLGRWPANVIHDGSDEVVELFPSVKGATSRTPTKPSNATSYVLGGDSNTPIYDDGLNTSAARFFYCAKASKKDRNEGLDGFEEVQLTGGGGLTAELREDGSLETASAGGKYGSIKAKKANHHPTVKPTTLMQYLVRLVTPPNGIVLDPFLGSGSTGKAAMYEGFNFIGIELTPEYLPIAKARIEFALQNKELELDFEPR